MRRLAGTALLLVLSIGCSRGERTVAKELPFRLEPSACPSADASASRSGSVKIGVSTGPGQQVCEYSLDERATVKVSLRSEPAGGRIFVDGGPAPAEIEIALLPLIADEDPAALRAWHPKDDVRKAVRTRVADRSRTAIEVRGAERTDEFQLEVIDFDLNETAWGALVREAAKIPAKPRPDGEKGIFLRAASGRTLIAGRKNLTLADFDWYATEEEIARSPVRDCTYTNGRTRPLVAVGTKVVVTTRDGKPVAEKTFAADKKNARCDSMIFEVEGAEPTGPALHYPNVAAWLNTLATTAAGK